MSEDETLFCDHCRCVYAGIRQAGDRCNDLSWTPDQWAVISWPRTRRNLMPMRVHRWLMCTGRVWPEGHPRLTKRWMHAQLYAEHERLRQLVQAELDARRSKPNTSRKFEKFRGLPNQKPEVG